MRPDSTEAAHSTEHATRDSTGHATEPTQTSPVVPLDTEQAANPDLTGTKAANLARAAAAGLPVLPGFTLVPPPSANGSGADAGTDASTEALRAAWHRLAGSANRPLAVRSSSRHEDTENSSMAGRFRTVLDVRGWDAFTDAVREVLDSAALDPAALDPAALADGDRATHDNACAPHDAAMAVLVQPMLHPEVGGVMFGADPVTGRTDRIVLGVAAGGPADLVDGSTQGVRYRMTRTGRLLDRDPVEPRGERLLGPSRLRRLAVLARRAAELFDGPQDIEFAFDADDHLWLLQSRPITAMAARVPRGARLLGPGPVAETFPGVLQPLEEDLWLGPMGHGLTVALDILGAASRRTLRSVPPVVAVDGRAAADLVLLGVVPPRHRVLNVLNPLPPARKVRAAWRLGRLRTTLPLLALDLMADVDRQLTELPAPARLSSGQVLDAASWGRRALSALHAQESLAGVLLGPGDETTVAAEALAVLTEGRAADIGDAALLAAHPVLLGLFPPSLTATAQLPPTTAWTGVPRGVSSLPVREGLRLRIRWVQEMQAGMIRAFGARLVAAGLLDDVDRTGLLRWSELVAVGGGGALPSDLAERRPRRDREALPTAFRLADGEPVPEPARQPRRGRGRTGPDAGQGAGGGSGGGTVWDGLGPRPERAVLVVRVLDPALAPLLPGLAGLVAETGSPLSHLAVLAREYRVPTATAVPDATARFPQGTEVTVDGGTGDVKAAETTWSADETAGGDDGRGESPAADQRTGDPSRHALRAHDPSAHDPSAHDPSAREPSAREPSAREPAAHDPAAHDPAARNPRRPPPGKGASP
ncbi:PEP/pyruvate-binding domain-containing protein [Yinghuangia sp. YIM S09857]|uniref:PEP/pyruvate-binding domain-containing protein n=1 Tax=Yinghuangia sp. YIM S09857 TaxID=3436929 RepID=UPI003F530EB0